MMYEEQTNHTVTTSCVFDTTMFVATQDVDYQPTLWFTPALQYMYCMSY